MPITKKKVEYPFNISPRVHLTMHTHSYIRERPHTHECLED